MITKIENTPVLQLRPSVTELGYFCLFLICIYFQLLFFTFSMRFLLVSPLLKKSP